MQDKLLTNSQRVRRRIASDARCCYCHAGIEDVTHILRDCPFAARAWEPGPSNWMTLNSDGSVIQPSGKAAAGGLIRNEAGHCVAAYTMNIGICSVIRAELRGVIYGLNKAWELGYRKILVYMDSEAAINLLQGDEHPNHHHAAEVSHFRGLCNRE
ncbi:Putative ribonuclease H protein At1g65750 [Linum perenne]